MSGLTVRPEPVEGRTVKPYRASLILAEAPYKSGNLKNGVTSPVFMATHLHPCYRDQHAMSKYLIALLLLTFFSINLQAAPSIAVLEFELKDLTLKPGVPAEIKRTASIKPLLEGELRSAGYQIVTIPLPAQQAANSGVGYLFDHADVSAQLAKRFDADYVVVGRLHKPSFLFAYLMADLVRVADAKVVGKFISESKGPNAELTIKAVESLTVKIDHSLENRYTPPAPLLNISPRSLY